MIFPSPEVILAISRSLDRLIASVSGIIGIYLGYLLFLKGVSGEASLKVRQDNSGLQIANAAPGIFFALFGAIILLSSIWNGLDIDEVTTDATGDSASINFTMPPESPKFSEFHSDDAFNHSSLKNQFPYASTYSKDSLLRFISLRFTHHLLDSHAKHEFYEFPHFKEKSSLNQTLAESFRSGMRMISSHPGMTIVKAGIQKPSVQRVSGYSGGGMGIGHSRHIHTHYYPL